jgi:GrpB-like predicted nucleotidyltransferase (UPF0157 family)
MQDWEMSGEHTSDEQLRAVTIGEPEVLSGPVELVEYDPAWPSLFEHEATKIAAALDERTLQLEHVGSTSIPGLVAKPRIDIVLAVADSADEPSYVPALESASYMLRIREPKWFEHRLLRGSEPAVNLHVFSVGCPEIERLVAFRDWLRTNEADRDLYARHKQGLARRDWKYVQNYADAKTAIVEEILTRARPALGASR